MLYHNVRLMGSFLIGVDAIAIGVSSAAVWQTGVLLGYWGSDATWQAFGVFCATVVIVFPVLGARMHTYHARRTEGVARELGALSELALYSTALACMASEIFTRGAPGRMYSTMLLADGLVLAGIRLLTRGALRRLRRKGDDYRVWLVVGLNRQTIGLAEAILANRHFGIRIEEMVDLEEPNHETQEALRAFSTRTAGAVHSRVVKDVEAIRNIVATRVIDEVVITLPVRDRYKEIQSVLDICCQAGLSVKLPPDIFERSSYKTELTQVGSIPMVTHYTGPSHYGQLFFKRVIDAAGAAAGMILFFPVFILLAALIKLTSSGSVFFLQTRVGLHGRNFRMVKFRSMDRDAAARQHELARFNQRDEVAFKMRGDPRVTPVGRIMRKFHLDELPQLWNVLVGDMSLVGPRPLPPGEANGNEWWQRRRLSMPPGLTCFWQVRDNQQMAFREWMQLDLTYIDGWSVWLDLKLIARTVPALIRGKGW